MKAKHLILTALTLVMLLPLCSCKPTEKGYKLAYDMAKQKERQGMDDETFEEMTEQSLPPRINIGGVEMRRQGEFLTLVYPEQAAQHTQLQRYNPCIGKYKMLFNAKSHTDRLRAEGLPANLLRGPGDTYYVCIGTYSTEEIAANALAKYLKSHKAQYVGLDLPLLLITAR